jgi:hypothetical protein
MLYIDYQTRRLGYAKILALKKLRDRTSAHDVRDRCFERNVVGPI